MVRPQDGGRTGIGFLARILGGGGGDPEPAKGDVLRIAEVEAVLTELRPVLVADGGDVRVAEVTPAGHVELQLLGACGHCFQSPVTVQGLLEPRLREACDWVSAVHIR